MRIFLKSYFYFGMSLLIAAVVVYGFSHTIDQNLLHPAIARPLILYIHSIIFFGWVIFFIVQTALVRIRNVRLHRKLGWFGAALGIAIIVLGISTAITMARFRITNFKATNVESDLLVQFFDMISFSLAFALAIIWRKRIEFHRRLILVASCTLTSAAFGRFPSHIIPANLFYAGVDALIFLGVIYDFAFSKRIHSVYLIGLPILIFGQATVMYATQHNFSFWTEIARAILR